MNGPGLVAFSYVLYQFVLNMLYLSLYGLSLYYKQLIYRVYEARTGHQERQWPSVSPTSSTSWCAQEQASLLTVCLSITVLVLEAGILVC